MVGSPGSGKTTFARQVADRLGTAAQDLDQLASDSADMTDHERWNMLHESAQQLAGGDSWVTEGIYCGWTEPLMDRADVIVWIDLPPHVTVFRVVRRHLRRSLHGTNPHRGLRLLVRFCTHVWSDSTRPAATDDQLRTDVGTNSRATVEERLNAYTGKVVHCRTPHEVQLQASRWQLEPLRRDHH